MVWNKIRPEDCIFLWSSRRRCSWNLENRVLRLRLETQTWFLKMYFLYKLHDLIAFFKDLYSCTTNPALYVVCLLCVLLDVRFLSCCWHLVYEGACLMHPLCSSHLLRQEGESLTQVSHFTLQICINIKWMQQAALYCDSGKPVELIRKGI